MLQRILSEKEEALLTAERRVLGDLRVALSRLKVAAEDQKTLERSLAQLDELFLLVVVGEFNSGKSTVINALLGQKLLEEGVTPTTTRIHLLRYGEETERQVDDADVHVLSAPIEMLREINIVDTPGTNAIYRQHEALTQRFVPRSDIVLFVTSVDRPFTESERLFLQAIKNWGKKVVLILNKVDILESEEDLTRVEKFVAENARDLLEVAPEVFPTSARQALRAKENGNEEALAASRFPALEDYIVATLDERERLRLKLLNPLGVAQHLVRKYQEVITSRLDLLQRDFDAIENIERQLEVYKEDLGRDFRYRLADVNNTLHEMEARGLEFFDETLRLGRIFDLVNKAAIKAEFEREVVAGTPEMIEKRVSDVIDWLVASDVRQWQSVMDYLGQRRLEHADRIVGQIGGSFDYDRTRLLETLGRTARQVIDGYDEREEAAKLADSVQMAVASVAAVEVGAIGLGAIITIIATSTMADITGIAAAGAVAALGLFIIPARRRQAKAELKSKVATMREELVRTLTHQFDEELDRSVRRIKEAIAPYTRFVRAERTHWTQAAEEIEAIGRELARIEAGIKEI